MSHNKAILAKMHAAIITEERPIQIACAMYYAENSPYEVVFMSADGTVDGEPVEWHYARDLLVEGLTGKYDDDTADAMYGDGDVKVFTKEQFLYTMLQSGDHHMIIAFMKTDIQTFLQETAKIVPIGAEAVDLDIDAELAALLDGEEGE